MALHSLFTSVTQNPLFTESCIGIPYGWYKCLDYIFWGHIQFGAYEKAMHFYTSNTAYEML